jgi:hypothetical protein
LAVRLPSVSRVTRLLSMLCKLTFHSLFRPHFPC